MRNTNWRKRSGKKNQCRLALDPFANDTSTACESIPWLAAGTYRIDKQTFQGENYYSMTPVSSQELTIQD